MAEQQAEMNLILMLHSLWFVDVGCVTVLVAVSTRGNSACLQGMAVVDYWGCHVASSTDIRQRSAW